MKILPMLLDWARPQDVLRAERLILVLAFVARLTVILLLPDQNFADALAYKLAGQALWAGHFMVPDNYMPLYPLWTGLVGNGFGLELADGLLSILTVWMIMRLARVIAGAGQTEKGAIRVGLVAGLIAAIYPYFLFYVASRLTETFYLTLLTGAFLLLYRRAFVWGSILLVLGVLTRPTLEMLNPALILLFSQIVHREHWSRSLRHLAVYAALYGLLMAPWWGYNFEKYGQFVRLNLGDGIVLYSGNNPMNTSGGGVSGQQKQDDMDLSPFLAISNPVARNQAMKEAAIGFIRENPRRFAKLAGIKFMRFWRLWPYAGEYENAKTIAISLASFGPVLAASLAFILWRGWRNRRTLAPVLALVFYLTLVHMATIGSIRYRLPLEPFMIALAAGWASGRKASAVPVPSNSPGSSPQ